MITIFWEYFTIWCTYCKIRKYFFSYGNFASISKE